MKPKVSFKQAVEKNRQKVISATLNGVRVEKSIRVLPRSEGEKIALCKAVIHTVNEAKRSGKLKKTAKGYTLSWKC
ncbi:hypothetical protein SCACP_37110 [Sporomusa carbonis]|uniref:hypothetical protein n=1 Tax=Sporomusa carbonis TaxID=3076075 RepID=UPI003A654F2F